MLGSLAITALAWVLAPSLAMAQAVAQSPASMTGSTVVDGGVGAGAVGVLLIVINRLIEAHTSKPGAATVPSSATITPTDSAQSDRLARLETRTDRLMEDVHAIATAVTAATRSLDRLEAFAEAQRTKNGQ